MEYEIWKNVTGFEQYQVSNKGRAMKDPEIELKRRTHNIQTGQNLTYEEFCLYEIRNLYKADKIPAKEFKTTIGIERNVKKQIMRKL